MLNINRFFRFRLRTLFVVTTILAVYFGLIYPRVQHDAARLHALQQLSPDANLGPRNMMLLLDNGESVSWPHEVGRKRLVYQMQLAGPGYTDADLIWISHFPELRELRLNMTNVTGKELACLKKFKRLHLVSFFQSARFSNAGLEHLVDLPRLRTLMLQGTSVTDACIETLGKIKLLRSFGFNNTSLTRKGALQLHQLLPDCKIYPYEYLVSQELRKLMASIRDLGGTVECNEHSELSKIFFRKNADIGIKLLVDNQSLLPQLSFLGLANSDITTDGFALLLKLRTLKSVNLLSTSLSKGDAQMLSTQIKGRVSWSKLGVPELKM